jgi:hypothetical protein
VSFDHVPVVVTSWVPTLGTSDVLERTGATVFTGPNDKPLMRGALIEGAALVPDGGLTFWADPEL